MIPHDKITAVERGLDAAFGVAKFDDVSEITKGHTNSLVYRISVRGTPYLLKIIQRNEDPSRHHKCMRAAAEAGVAPRVWHTDVESKMSITDFVESVPFAADDALARLPRVLRKLHSLPVFDEAPFNTTCTFLLADNPMNAGFLQRFQATGLLSDGDIAELNQRLAELRQALGRDNTQVASSHNDLFKPDNILFDGNSAWLVDWEAAFRNDPYADLAVIANMLVHDERDEAIFLREYFGAPPDSYQQARFHLMQQLAHLFYTMAFLQIGSAGQPIDWRVPAPAFQDFHRRMWSGETDLANNAVKVIHGRVHWERLLHNVSQPRYGESLRILTS